MATMHAVKESNDSSHSRRGRLYSVVDVLLLVAHNGRKITHFSPNSCPPHKFFAEKFG
jgi:hypothetical protein